jgi:hypothetical protein
MFSNFNKHKKKYAALILAAYVLLVSISILHYHHINVQTGNYAIQCDSQRPSGDVFDKFVDITHECTIQHFTETIINYSFIAVFNVIPETSVQNFSFKEIVMLLVAPHDSSNPFRAPPLFS